MNGEVRVVDDVAAAFCEVVAEAWHGRPGPGFSIALSGGATARRCYEALAVDASCPVDWMQTEVYWGDERCVPHDDPASNYRVAREALLEGVGGVHALFPMRCDEGGADEYHLLLSTVGAIDLVHLGLGADGHTASLFPGSPAIDADPGRFVVPNHDPTGRNPHPRMTLTWAGIGLGRRVVVTVSGPEKADAVARLRAGDDLPAARLQGPDLLWLVDRAAAAA